jgi:hypothetical protein
VYSPDAFEPIPTSKFNDRSKSFQKKKREKCMEERYDTEISPKLRIFAPLKAYIHEEWTFMHHLLGLFAKSCINLKKNNTLPGEI